MTGPRGVARASALAFLTAAATLFTQVLVHRMISAKLLNNFAFLVISLTMLGFACSGVVLTRLLPAFLRHLHDAVAASSALFALSLLGASWAFYRADFDQFPESRLRFILALLGILPVALLFALPFAFCGLILGALLSAPDLPTRRIYLFDLLGSGLGAFAVIPAIGRLGVEPAILLASAALLGGTVLLLPPRGAAARLLVAAAGLALVASFVGRARVFAMTYPSGTMLRGLQTMPEPFRIEHVRWDPVGRIEVARWPPPDLPSHNYPCLIGSNRAFHQRFKYLLTQNNYAFTYAVDYDGDRASLDGIQETLYSAAYHATSVAGPRVAIIGVGGGFDVLTALYFGASRVRAVEINGATVAILRRVLHDYFRAWVEDPRVTLVLDEGRHHLATTDERFDVVQLSGVDSYSGTAAAAHIFSESYLYTSEAFDLYLSRLADQGILNMMRLEYEPSREMLRALVTAVGALRRAHVPRPADHIVMLTAKPRPNFTVLLVKKTPFTADEVGRLEDWAAASPYFSLSAAPALDQARANNYQRFLSLDDPRQEAAFVAAAPLDISAVDDDRPFFFRYSQWRHLLNSGLVAPVMEDSILVLTAVIGLLAVVAIYLPLRWLTRGSGRPAAAFRVGLFFAATAVGYLAVEIALLQKFGLFLGHPNYALSVVLAALLVTSGVGSLLSAAIVRGLGRLRFVSYVLAAVILGEWLLVFPRLAGWIGLPFGARVALVFALVAPVGVCLGTFVPSAVEQLKATAPASVPWAWGINGIFSVLAPVVSVAFSMTWGISALLLATVPIYLVVGFALPEVPGP